LDEKKTALKVLSSLFALKEIKISIAGMPCKLNAILILVIVIIFGNGGAQNN